MSWSRPSGGEHMIAEYTRRWRLCVLGLRGDQFVDRHRRRRSPARTHPDDSHRSPRMTACAAFEPLPARASRARPSITSVEHRSRAFQTNRPDDCSIESAVRDAGPHDVGCSAGPGTVPGADGGLYARHHAGCRDAYHPGRCTRLSLRPSRLIN